MSEQLTIGDALALEGMSAAVNAASLSWVQAAHTVLDALIADRVPFTSEDILTVLEAHGVSTTDNRALGGILRSVAREGRVVMTGEYRKAQRPQAHARPQAVWVARVTACACGYAECCPDCATPDGPGTAA